MCIICMRQSFTPIQNNWWYESDHLLQWRTLVHITKTIWHHVTEHINIHACSVTFISNLTIFLALLKAAFYSKAIIIIIIIIIIML